MVIEQIPKDFSRSLLVSSLQSSLMDFLLSSPSHYHHRPFRLSYLDVASFESSLPFAVSTLSSDCLFRFLSLSTLEMTIILTHSSL